MPDLEAGVPWHNCCAARLYLVQENELINQGSTGRNLAIQVSTVLAAFDVVVSFHVADSELSDFRSCIEDEQRQSITSNEQIYNYSAVS